LGHSTEPLIAKGFDKAFEDTFQKDGKYRLLVIRGMEKIEDTYKFVNSGSLEVRTHDCAKNNGVILGYDCLDTANFKFAVTREGRIDSKFMPAPLETEDLSIWKQFLKFVKPIVLSNWAAKYTDEAREIFARQGEQVLEEMEPYIRYNVPFKYIAPSESLNKWKQYIQESAKILEPEQKFVEFSESVNFVVKDYLKGRISEKQYKSIIDMVMNNIDEVQKGRMSKIIENSLVLNQR
jgi:hypothetical protein